MSICFRRATPHGRPGRTSRRGSHTRRRAATSRLSAAYHLAKLGHEVEVRDAGAQPGGMMRYGISAYRLPREVLDGEVVRIEALGVRFISDHRVSDLDAERQEGRFDAVFVAVGAHLSKRTADSSARRWLRSFPKQGLGLARLAR
jgi:putative intracellular protease/amidase